MRQPDYAKVFVSILDSTIANNWRARHLFEDMLKLADWRGHVDATPEAICRRTGWPFGLEALREDLAILGAPDEHSRSPEEDGRRIVPIEEGRPWGWRIVNIEAYRSRGDLEQVRAAARERQKRRRDRLRLVENEPDDERPAIDAGATIATADDVTLVLGVLRALAGKLRAPDASLVRTWIAKAGGDVWALLTVLCELEIPLRRARRPAYVTEIVDTRHEWPLRGDEARRYVEHRVKFSPEGARRRIAFRPEALRK